MNNRNNQLIKEWILSEEEKQLIKEKIIQNKLRKQQMEIERNNMIDRSLKNPDDPLSATTTSSKITTTTTTTITTKTITKKSIRNQKTSSKNSEHPRKRVSNIENANDCVGIYRMGLIEDRPKSLMMTNNHMLVSKTKPTLSPSKSKSISTNRSYRSRKKLFESTRYKEDDEKNRFIKSKKNDRSSSSRRLDYNRKLDRSNLFLQQYQNHFDENAVQMINYHCDQSSDSNFAPFEPIESFSRRNKPEPYSIPSPYTFSTSSPDLPHQQQNHYYHHHHHQQHQFNQNLSIGNEEYWKDGNLYLDFFPRKNNHFNVSNRQSFGQCCSLSSEIFSPSSSSSSSSPSLSSIGSSSLNIANTLPSKLFHEPSAYSLDTLLTSDESDAFFDDSLDSSIYNQNFAWPNSTENCSNHWNENYEKNIAHIEHKISNEIFNPTINQTQNTVYNNSNCCKDLNSFQTSSPSAENIALKQIIVNTDESLNIHNNLNDEIKVVIETNNNQENLKRPNESIRLLSSSINQNRNYSTMIDSDSIQSDQMSSELKSAKQPTQPVLSVHLSDMHERNHSKSSTNDDNKIEKTSCQRNLLEANDFVKNSSDSNKNLEISTSFTDEFLPNYIDDLFDSLDCLKYSEANASSGPNVIESNETKVDSQKQVKDSDEILNYRNKIGEKNIDSNNADDYGYDCDQSSISKSIVSSSALNDLDTKQIESDLFDFNYDDLITHIIDEKNLLLSNEIEMISFDDGDKWEKKIDLLVAKPNLTRESIEDFVCFARKPSRFDEENSKDKTSIVIDKGEMKKIDDFSQYLLHDNDPPLISQQYGQSQLSSSSFLQHHHHKDIRNQRLTTLSKRKSSETNHNRFKINFLENSSQREESIIPSAIVFENVSHKNSCNRSENKSIPFFGLENNHSLSIDNDDGGDSSRFGNSKKFRIYDDVDYYDLSYENDAAAVDVEDVICDGAMMDSLDYPRTVLNAKHNQNQANDLFDYNHQHHHDQYDLDRSRSFQNFRNSLPISIQSSIDRWILSSLTIADRCLIQELSIACSILKNPYKRIVYKSSSYNHNCMVTEFYIHRLIRMSKRITAFNSLTFSNQLKLLKNGIIEMICLRSVQLYDPDREAWNFLDVSLFNTNC
ncbi:non-structural maintenance of chromosomes element 4 A-like [Sarcoptes scabiei]|nr:non-structural maintenance of chromosomes element 4 A-like [Sarcoptes scabiei]